LGNFVTPKVVISKCIEFDRCRYDGHMIANDFVKKLKLYVRFLPVCPEFEIGLGIPRNPVRLIDENGSLEMIQPATNRNLTAEMMAFAQSFLESLENVDGFILKAGSPSCGIKNTKIYPRIGKVAPKSRNGRGLFGDAVSIAYPYLAIEDEGRLNNPRIKDHFLSQLFTLARFRVVKQSGSINELVKFHSQNKFLLMAYNQAELKTLGKITANGDERSPSELLKDYQSHLYKALSRAPKYTSNINALMHILGYFSDKINKGEKSLFLDNLQKYREGRVTICPSKILLKSWIMRFEDEYLFRQSFFEPYPSELMEIDPIISHKGRDMWG